MIGQKESTVHGVAVTEEICAHPETVTLPKRGQAADAEARN